MELYNESVLLFIDIAIRFFVLLLKNTNLVVVIFFDIICRNVICRKTTNKSVNNRKMYRFDIAK